MIRVLHILGGLTRGGAESMIMNFYRAMDKEKVQFDFIIHTKEHQSYYDEIINMGGRIYSFPRFNGKNLCKIKKNWHSFFEEHQEYKILHSHVRSYASIYIPIAKKYGVTTIIHSHSTSNGSGFSSIFKKVMQIPLRWQADYFFGCSKESGKWLFGKKIVKTHKFYCLKNAIDVNKYKPNNIVRDEYRKKMAIDDKIVFVHIGRFHPSKNHKFLLNLFHEIKKKNENSVLILIGDGDLRNDIINQIDKLSLSNDVKLLGVRDDIPYILQACDCLLFPSRWEGLPVTVVEAQAAGLQCLISDKITEDVKLTELVHYLPIDQGYGPWLDVLKNNFTKKDVSDIIIESGYDINSTSKWLLNFYMGISNE